jgi:hypothetical protein
LLTVPVQLLAPVPFVQLHDDHCAVRVILSSEVGVIVLRDAPGWMIPQLPLASELHAQPVNILPDGAVYVFAGASHVSPYLQSVGLDGAVPLPPVPAE